MLEVERLFTKAQRPRLLAELHKDLKYFKVTVPDDNWCMAKMTSPSKRLSSDVLYSFIYFTVFSWGFLYTARVEQQMEPGTYFLC